VRFLGDGAEVEAAVSVDGVAVERGDHRVDQFAHGSHAVWCDVSGDM
jgi:hypothetical protein